MIKFFNADKKKINVHRTLPLSLNLLLGGGVGEGAREGGGVLCNLGQSQ